MSDENFDKALKFTLKWEAGYVNDPNDKGGETNKGITKAVYDKWRKDGRLTPQSVKQITDEEVRTIYYELYWEKAICTALDDAVAIAHFDCAVNTGVGQAIKILQRAVGAKEDGAFGPKTMDKVNNTRHLLSKIIQAREDFYLDLGKKKEYSPYLKGWLNRTNDLKSYLVAG